ncbi:MAG TPA: L-glutamate gamma-semialdehyde dehydrogenase [bacterium]|nr:L-glutamate gamma-semialdehyde dehydrogenase [bacterium]HPS30310.1 L-glutamate gamma-semialdehyde dehydrogenase [bacterium]
MSSNAIFTLTRPENEPVFSYAPGTPERDLLKKELNNQKNQHVEIPMIIGGKEIRTGKTVEVVSPHDYKQVLGVCHLGGEKEVNKAIESAMKAKKEWEEMDWYQRASIFLKAGELLSTRYRYTMNAATMLGQSKTCHQAEIDSACELIDFYRFNAHYLQEIYRTQQIHNSKGVWNRLEYRALEGFVFAVTPFNFTAIAGNLPLSPAIMGNTVLWKPASTSLLSNYYIMQILKEAGLPDGVINFLPGSGGNIGNPAIDSEYLGGIHFTGSTGVFGSMWQRIAGNVRKYRSYPKIVGETGGKDFIFVHSSANVDEVAVAAVRGAFEYQGQKCSAASRMYVPRSMWKELSAVMSDMTESIKMGDVCDFTNFMGAVIDQKSFDTTMAYIAKAKESSEARIIAGGTGDNSKGYFIRPTVIETTNPHFLTMEEEIFAPVMTVFVYDDGKFEETLDICDNTSPYALTGAFFATDRKIIAKAEQMLRHCAGNFYINDKPTGAVVGQQPFGGARGSGTNDKAGSHMNLLRWTSPRAIKESFVSPKKFEYPFMDEK